MATAAYLCLSGGSAYCAGGNVAAAAADGTSPRHATASSTLVARASAASYNGGSSSRSTSLSTNEADASAQREAAASQQQPSASRRALLAAALPVVAVSQLLSADDAEAVSSSRRALREQRIPEEDYKTLPSGLKVYDIKVGGGKLAEKGDRVTVHYVVKWKGITFMTSRQGMGVTGGTPYGFDVGSSDIGYVLKGLDLGVQGMRVGGERQLIVPPELAYGNKGVQEIPPNATLEMNIELLSIKQNAFGTQVKLIEG